MTRTALTSDMSSASHAESATVRQLAASEEPYHHAEDTDDVGGVRTGQGWLCGQLDVAGVGRVGKSVERGGTALRETRGPVQSDVAEGAA